MYTWQLDDDRAASGMKGIDERKLRNRDAGIRWRNERGSER